MKAAQTSAKTSGVGLMTSMAAMRIAMRIAPRRRAAPIATGSNAAEATWGVMWIRWSPPTAAGTDLSVAGGTRPMVMAR